MEANSETSVAFDVDGTLIHQAGPKADTPRYDVIELFLTFKKLGCRMIIWSGSGVDYARTWAEKLGLEAEFVEKGSMIPRIIFDDMEAMCGKVIIRV